MGVAKHGEYWIHKAEIAIWESYCESLEFSPVWCCLLPPYICVCMYVCMYVCYVTKKSLNGTLVVNSPFQTLIVNFLSSL